MKLSRKNLKRLLPVGWYWVILALIDLRIRILPYSWNRRLLAPGPVLPSSAANRTAEIAADECSNLSKRIETLLGDIKTASARSWKFNMGCLRMALLLRFLLKSKGVSTILVYGVVEREDKPMPFLAHSWLVVESPELLKGKVLDPGISQSVEYKEFQISTSLKGHVQ